MTANLRKRPLVGLVVLAAVLSISAFAEDKPAFQTKGSARFRWNHYGNVGGATVTDYAEMRFRPEFWFNPGSDLSVMFQPQFSQTVGSGGFSGTTSDSAMNTHQAFMNYMPNDSWKLQFGRFEMSYGDELLIGPVGWSNVGRSFEGMRVSMSHSMGWADVFATTLTENSPFSTPATSFDKALYGIYTGWKLSEEVKALEVYFLMQKDPAGLTAGAGGTDISSMSAYGARLKAAMSGLDLRFEYTGEKNPQQTSSTADTSGTQMDAEVGYSMESPWKWRIAGEYADASKDYNQMYPTGHKWLGYADLLGRRNVTSIVGHLTMSPNADWNFGLDYHMFSRKDTATGIYGTGGAAVSGVSGTANAEKGIGSEIDLTIKYNASKNVSFTGGYSMLTYGDFIKNQGSFGGATKGSFAYLMAEAKF